MGREGGDGAWRRGRVGRGMGGSGRPGEGRDTSPDLTGNSDSHPITRPSDFLGPPGGRVSGSKSVQVATWRGRLLPTVQPESGELEKQGSSIASAQLEMRLQAHSPSPTRISTIVCARFPQHAQLRLLASSSK